MILKTLGYSFPEAALKERYLRSLHARLGIGFLLFVLILVVSVFSVSKGSMHMSIGDILKALFNLSEGSYVVWNIRIPRTLGALLAGASLGVAGAVMQTVLRNPLASPFTLGISHGAAFGAAFAIIVLGSGKTYFAGTGEITILKGYVVVFSAFVGALATVIVILGLSFWRELTPEAIILVGVALSSLFTAATMLLQYFASDFQVAATVFWTFGDLGKAGWFENKLMALAFIISFIYFIKNRWNFNALLWGDEVAKSLGVDVKRLRSLGMFFSAFVVSVCTAFLGIIGFVGLISPHIVRLLVGGDHRFLIPYSALFGAFFLYVSDLIGRTIMAPAVLPVGIITSFAGVPMFFYLLMKKRRLQ